MCGFSKCVHNPCSFLEKVEKKSTEFMTLVGAHCKPLSAILTTKSLCSSFSFFTRIICVVLSCFILLADSFTMVKIDDRYPDEWND